jgi:hypothetical protein
MRNKNAEKKGRRDQNIILTWNWIQNKKIEVSCQNIKQANGGWILLEKERRRKIEDGWNLNEWCWVTLLVVWYVSVLLFSRKYGCFS